MNKKLLELAFEAIKFNKVEYVFVSGDGEVFTDPNNAVNHRQRAENKDIYQVHVSGQYCQVFNTGGVIQEPEVMNAEDAPIDATSKEPAVKPLNKMNKEELQAECKGREIEFTDEHTKAELIDLIEKADAAKAAAADQQ